MLTTSLELPVRRPFAADALLSFLRNHAVPGVEFVDRRTFGRALRLAGGDGIVSLTLPSDDDATEVTAAIRLEDAADLQAAIAACRRLLDLGADPVAIDQLLASDPALAPSVAATPGLRVPGAVDGPETLIRTMLGQQVSVAGARTAAARLVYAAGHRLGIPHGELTNLFPTSGAIAALGPEVIAGPRRRAQAIIHTARAMAEGELIVTAERPAAELTADLIARPGIGPWTAGYLAMRLGSDRDVLLTGDLVLRQGAILLGLPGAPRALADRSTGWRPFRSYAGMHLWAVALAQRTGRDR